MAEQGFHERGIRVFVSSTFRDMHAERDHLNRVVFPELRSRCRQRGVEFVGVDLRWGVTETESKHQGVLAISLAEIERSRPLFVGLLGERFGWVPPPEEIPAPIYERLSTQSSMPEDVGRWYALDELSTPPTYRLRRTEDAAVPDSVGDRLATFWAEHGLAEADESITAREILRGVFAPEFPKNHGLFYFRNPGVEQDAGFPPSLVPIFVEPSPVRRAKLQALKARIRNDGRLGVHDYDVCFRGLKIDAAFLPSQMTEAELSVLRDGVIGPGQLQLVSDQFRAALELHGTVALGGMDAFGERVLGDLWSAIEAELDRPAVFRDGHERERAYHETFVRHRTRLFFGRADVLQRVLADISSDEANARSPLVVTAPPGTGKSALLAECVRSWREQSASAIVVPCFIGAAPGSTLLSNVLRSMTEEVRRLADLDEPLPEDDGEVRKRWHKWLEKAARRRPVLLVIDALDQLDPLDRSHELGWLPFELPVGAKLVCSTLAGDCLDRLRRRLPTRVLELPPFAEEDAEALVRALLEARGKKLREDPRDESRDQLRRLLDTRVRADAGLPLYLCVAIEELCLHGDSGTLDERIQRLPSKLPDLFDQVLARVEQDHGRELAESTCRWLAASRSGLLEAEVLDLWQREGTRELQKARWTRLRRDLDAYLRPVDDATGAGMLDFYHQQIRAAVYRRYFGMASLDAPGTRQLGETHRELASYFRWSAKDETASTGSWRLERTHALSELPHHLIRAADVLAPADESAPPWAELGSLLSNMHFVQAKCQAGLAVGLQRDYVEALEHWPGGGYQQGGGVATEYAASLTAYAEWHSDHRRRAPPAPSPAPPPPHSFIARLIRRWRSRAEPEAPLQPRARLPGEPTLPRLPITDDSGGSQGDGALSSIDRLQAWRTWAANHAADLSHRIAPVLQVAYNSANGGPVAEAAQQALDAVAPQPWLRLLNRPRFRAQPLRPRTIDVDAYHIVMTADGAQAVTSGSSGLLLWDLVTGETRVLSEQDFGPICLSADGSQLVVRGRKRLYIGDVITGAVRELEGDASGDHLSITPDGRWAVTLEDTLRSIQVSLWDLQSAERRVFAFEGERMSVVRVAPDGRRILVGGWREVRLCDLDTGRSYLLGTHDDQWVTDLFITPDGARAISAGRDETIRLWDPFTAQARAWNLMSGKAIEGKAVPSIATEARRTKTEDGYIEYRPAVGGAWVFSASADGRRVVSGGSDWELREDLWDTLRVWDMATGQSYPLRGHTGGIRAVSLTPDGRWAATLGDDCTLRVWDLRAGSYEPLAHPGPVTALALGARERVVVSAGKDRKLRSWHTETGEPGPAVEYPTRIDAVALGDEERLAHVWSGGDLSRVDIGTGQRRGYWWRAGAMALAVTTDGRVFVVNRRGEIARWDAAQGLEPLTLSTGHKWVGCAAVSADGRRLLTAAIDLRLLDIESGRVATLTGHLAPVTELCVSANAAWAASADESGVLRLWNLDTREGVTLRGRVDRITALAISSDGRRLLSAGDKGIRLWDTRHRTCRRLEGPGHFTSSIALAANGRRAVLAGNKTLRVWDLDRRRSRVAKDRTACVTSLSLSGDGRYAVSGDNDGRLSLRLWDLEAGTVTSFAADDTALVALSEDGTRAVSISTHYVARLWDRVTGSSVIVSGPGYVPLTESIQAAAVTPDGRCLASAHENGTVKVWDPAADQCYSLHDAHEGAAVGVCLSLNGRRAVSWGGRVFNNSPYWPESSDAHTLHVLDVATGGGLTFGGNAGTIREVCLTPDGCNAIVRRSASAARWQENWLHKDLSVWDLENQTIRGLEPSGLTLCVLPSGRALLGTIAGALWLWDLRSGDSRVVGPVPVPPTSLLVTTDEAYVIVMGSGGQLRILDMETGQPVAAHSLSAGDFTHAHHRYPILVAGTTGGAIDILAMEGLPKRGPQIATAARLFSLGGSDSKPCWDTAVTARCEGCGCRFPVPPAVLDAIAAIGRDANLAPHSSPCTTLPAECWDDARLSAGCPTCGWSMRFNPFVVDAPP